MASFSSIRLIRVVEMGTGAAEQVTQGDGATVQVHLLVHQILQTQILHAGQGLGGKPRSARGQVDVADGQPGPA